MQGSAARTGAKGGPTLDCSGPPSEGASAGGDETRCAFATEDIEADHATLQARGVAVDWEIARAGNRRSGLVSISASVPDPVPQFFFRELDGNRFLFVDSRTD